MDDITKIALSETELDKVLDSEWILTKHLIIEKVYQLFNMQVPVIRGHFFSENTVFSEEVTYAVPKISKGENYLQLPYVMLDHPAVFSREHIFAVRTMFWWGNFISVSLLLRGNYQQALAPAITHGLLKDPSGFFICVNENEWEHHFAANNYQPAEDYPLQQLASRPFIKIAVKFKLQDWNKMPGLLSEAYGKMASLLKGS